MRTCKKCHVHSPYRYHFRNFDLSDYSKIHNYLFGQLTTLRSISIKIESLFSHCEWTRYQNTKTPQNIILSLPSLAYFSYFSEKNMFFSYLLVLSYIFTKFPCATALFNNFRNLYIISKIISRLLQISL